MRGIKTISKYVLRGLEYAFGRPNIASENLSLAQEDIFLALSKRGSALATDIFVSGAFLWLPNRSSCRAPESVLERCSEWLLKRKYLWSDGGGNTIIYDYIVRWGIDLLPRRLLFRWERRCSVPLRSTSHLRLETNSRSGTKYGGRSRYIRYCLYEFYMVLSAK